MHNRPTHKELTAKLRKARNLLAPGAEPFVAADGIKLAANFYELGLFSQEEQYEALRAALAEVDAKKYSGRRPPERSFLKSVKDEELFTFIWDSQFFRKRMYLKFCICESGEFEEETLFVFSLHEDQPNRRVVRKRK